METIRPTILVTGSSGFIGFNLVIKLLSLNYKVIGVDMMNKYYDINLKNSRLNLLLKKTHNSKNFFFYKFNISNYKKLNQIFLNHNPDYVINLAAQAGVRDSILNPKKYLNYNILGFLNIAELSRKFAVKHLVYASTSSVYGSNSKTPYSEKDSVNHPIQFYAVSKRSNELMAHTWSHLYSLPTTALRFFTVYGPWGRPDMALFKFVNNISKGKKINLFNYGDHIRDFTYIDDIVDGIILSLKKIPKSKKIIDLKNNEYEAPFRILNLGYGKSITLKEFVKLIELYLNKKAMVNYLPLQPGDIYQTTADITQAKKIINYNPKIPPKIGVKRFIEWYKDFYLK